MRLNSPTKRDSCYQGAITMIPSVDMALHYSIKKKQTHTHIVTYTLSKGYLIPNINVGETKLV